MTVRRMSRVFLNKRLCILEILIEGDHLRIEQSQLAALGVSGAKIGLWQRGFDGCKKIEEINVGFGIQIGAAQDRSRRSAELGFQNRRFAFVAPRGIFNLYTLHLKKILLILPMNRNYIS